jgi:hypothetical protein
MSEGSLGQDSLGQVYFHCSNAKGVLVDRCGAAVADLMEAIETATTVVRHHVAQPSLMDWRDWILHISDDAGEEIFALPFASVLGKPN